MADPNDDLLEDVDIGDGHFELDLDEDALLADDYDEKPMKSLRTSDIGRNHISMEDEDFIEIGVDEDLALADEAKNEGDIGKTARKAIVFDDSNNDDSDEGGKERTRFKTERNINAVPRPTTAIPETLDAVAVKAQPNIAYNNRGGRGGQIIKRGFRGGIRGIGFQRGGGIHPRFRPQHPNNFGPMPPIHLQHKHHPDIGQSLHYQQNFSQMAMDSYSNEDCYQTPPTIPSQPSYQSQPLVQPPSTNIHVNPHFRGPRPQVNPNLTMWNGSGYAVSANQNPHQNYQHSQTSYQNHYQPAQSQQWSENNINDYYPPQNTSAATGNSYSQEEQYYNGVNAGSDHYYQQQSNQSNYQHSSATNLASNMAHHMNWNESGTNYYSNQSGPPPGPHHDLYNTQQLNPPIHQSPYRPQHNPHLPPHLQHKKVFMLNKKNPIFKNNKFQQTIANKGRGGKLMIHNMKKDVIQNKVTPPKPVRVETSALRKIQITNLHEVPVTNTVPQKKIIPEPEEEDEEMKAYRQKIEEQKKLREQVLKQKEEKRKVAAQQKFQMLAARKKSAEEQAANVNQVQNTANQPQFRIVRVRLQDGRTVIKKLSTAQISKLKKISSGTKPNQVPNQVKTEPAPKSRIVVVDNLSASTTQKQLENMAKQVGKVEKIKLNADSKRATVIFENTNSAAAFVQKFQRKMVDLSMISLKMVMNEDNDINTTSTNTNGSNSGSVQQHQQQQQQQQSNTTGSTTTLATTTVSTTTTTITKQHQQQQQQSNNKVSTTKFHNI